MVVAGRIEEADYRVQLSRVFAHLNRAWHGRDDTHLESITADAHADRSRFPDDLSPVG